MNAVNPYVKTIVALLGTIVTALAIYYGNASWYPIVTSVVTALTVYVAPNTPKAPAVTKVDVNSAYPTNLPSPMTEQQQAARDGWDKVS